MHGNFVFGEKMSPPFLSRCCPRGSLFFLFWVNWMMGAEGSCWKKTSPPPFWHTFFDFSEASCWSSLCTLCALFGLDALKGRSPVAFLHLCRRCFGSDLLKGRSPLAFLHLLRVCAEGFLVRTFWKVEAPWRFCTYCAFLPKVFWLRSFVRSKPLGVFALIVRLRW